MEEPDRGSAAGRAAAVDADADAPRTRSSPAWSGSPRRTPAVSPPDEDLSYVVNLKLADPADRADVRRRPHPDDLDAASPGVVAGHPRRLRQGGAGPAATSCRSAAGCSASSPSPASPSSSAAGWPTRPDASDCSKPSAAPRAWSRSCCSPNTWSWPCSRPRLGWRPDGWPLPCSPIPAPASSAAPVRRRSPCPPSAGHRRGTRGRGRRHLRSRRPRRPHQHRPRPGRLRPPTPAHAVADRDLGPTARPPAPRVAGGRPAAAPHRAQRGQHLRSRSAGSSPRWPPTRRSTPTPTRRWDRSRTPG